MGLFDQFANLNPEQTQGLLAAAAQLLQAGAPSRTPTSFGQALGAGLQGYQQGSDAYRTRQMQEQQAAQIAKLTGLKISDAESDLANQEQMRADAAKAQAILSARYQPQTDTSRAQSVLGENLAPTVDNAAILSTAPKPAGGSPDQYTQLMGDAQALRQAGLHKQADATMIEALKFKPEFSQTPQIGNGPDGKPALYVLDKDGNPKFLNGVSPQAKLRELNLGGITRLVDDNTITPGQVFTRTQTPDSLASNAIARERLAFDKSQAEDGTGPLTEASILNAAKRYNFDGTLPPMGMGKQAAAGRSAILNKAAELAGDTGDTGGRDAQLTNRGNLASQTAAIKAFTSGKQGNTVRSFNTAVSHLDTLDQLASQLGNTNTPAFNKVANFYAQQTGQAAPTSFNAAKKIVGDEIVKAIVGAGGGVADREEAAKTIDAANSPAQLKQVIKTYQELMVGQLGGLEQQYRTSTKRNDFSELLSDRAKEIYQQSHGSGSSQAPSQSQFSVTAPNGKTYNFPDAKSLANFKLTTGIK